MAASASRSELWLTVLVDFRISGHLPTLPVIHDHAPSILFGSDGKDNDR